MLGNSTAAHHDGARHTACSQQPASRTHFNASQPQTASGFSKQWDFAPPTAGCGVNKQKWRKNFQSMIYTHVCSPMRAQSAHIGSIQGTGAIFPSDYFVVSVVGDRKRRSQPRRTHVSVKLTRGASGASFTLRSMSRIVKIRTARPAAKALSHNHPPTRALSRQCRLRREAQARQCGT